jgi:hypothetical protein
MGLLSSRGGVRNFGGGQGMSHFIGVANAVAGVAWQPLVWRGIASGDDACNIGIMRRLGLQRTGAGGSAPLGYTGVVHHQKTAQATTLAC